MKTYTLGIAAGLVLAAGAAQAKDFAQKKGELDKEVIRRVVRRHLDEVKACYEPEVEKKKDLAGKVMVHFVVGGDGKVIKSEVQETTLGNATVEKCIADAVLKWEFPRPVGGGHVDVSYPFLLKPDGAK